MVARSSTTCLRHFARNDIIFPHNIAARYCHTVLLHNFSTQYCHTILLLLVVLWLVGWESGEVYDEAGAGGYADVAAVGSGDLLGQG